MKNSNQNNFKKLKLNIFKAYYSDSNSSKFIIYCL